ncbi:Hsp90 co-chaperone Cdc37 [Penicillium cataractarum]|uniref:Hsp90 chaperone protein kinase-targeting subunit n=1 Tax=Penicillium cataractarum TaxID=2100454 RepID=A0A9W9RRR0_9EURO|nr:Hsp90 co-chaperone Cdc37 [Penicillium cataractarum]KAJ5364470.1 Hsp90 co-chaperone Cdc37 [Penicillium cataractarum]
MVLDYSKWDALELSDDSDIEVHPNVDKRSFIRAKQAQIHQQREQRRHDIKTLKYERIINDGLLSRIDKLLNSLKQHEDSSALPEQFIFQTIMEFASDPTEDQAPPPPEGVHTHEKEQPKYSAMMSALVDQVKKEFGDSKPDNMFKAYITGVQGHKDKVQGLQKELLTRLAQLEKEESSKITSEGLHDGFNTSHVSKADPKPKPATPAKKAEVELLNPGAGSSSAAQAEDEDDDDDPANIEISPLAKRFAKLKSNDYLAYQRFITEHPEIVAEKETDGLLVEAFNSQLKGEDAYARQCVHQGLLLQYCRSLGPDGIKLFFGRITTKEHRAATLFTNDVNDTYNRIKTRAAELSKENSASNDPAGVEQIQLHAVDPNTKITINIPAANSEDPTEVEARKIFESFSADLQKALASESLDEVNKVLGKMSVEEAEVVVEQLGNGGMLSLEEGIIDGTTEEGQKKLAEIEAEAKQDVGEPGGDVTELD